MKYTQRIVFSTAFVKVGGGYAPSLVDYLEDD